MGRRDFLARGGLAVVGASAASTTELATGAGRAEAASGTATNTAQGGGRRLPWIMDMVQSNPGEAVVLSSFNDADKLAGYGYNCQVVNEFRPPTTAITYDSLNSEIFPLGSDERVWVDTNAARVDARIHQIHEAGLKALYFTDIITLPKTLVSLYQDQIVDSQGRINLDYPMTQQIHRVMLGEIFDRFPALDGLVIRTGETYLENVPYYDGNNPITRGAASHLILLDILRDEVCVKRDKLIFYRTWSFDGFTSDPNYYLSVADNIEPHPNLIFSIKHTAGDFWRTVPFNPTLTLGSHPQVVEIECQREYEAKGATPNYVLDGVINGFEEFRSDPKPIGLADIRDNKNFQGVWTWSRGGGWRGPYVPNELWCDLNVYVASHWAQDVDRSEESVFDDYARRAGIEGADRDRFRQLALLSATGVLHGHYSTVRPVDNTWTRDQFLGGSDQNLASDFASAYAQGQIDAMITEKAGAAATWRRIAELADHVELANAADRAYMRASSQYGELLYTAIYHGWAVMLLGVRGDHTGTYDVATMRTHIAAYDQAWAAYQKLPAQLATATCYEPYQFGTQDSQGLYHADLNHGLKPSVDHYRSLVS